MQQRGSNVMMETDDGDPSVTAPSRSRPNSKLVRSHAMREEASPPRVPSPCLLQSPYIKLTPSPEGPASPNPVLVLSPSRSSPQCASPTSTLVPTPNSRCSPQCASYEGECLLSVDAEAPSSPKYLNKSTEKPSHIVRKKYCDCQHQNCIKCSKERNINNNVTSVNNNMMGSPNMLSVSKATSRGKLRHQSSSQGSFEGSSSNSPCLSRDSSSEQYTDTTGVDLELFIPETLNRNAKDRALMLRIEQELVNLAKDRCKTHYKFPPMSSYQRMLVHRCAAYFGMDHNIEPSGKCVVVNKTKNTRIPDVEFKEHIKEDIVFSEEPRRSILKRDSNSMEEYFKSDRGYNMDNRRSKSFEEREEEYEKARRRIFNRGMQEASSEDFGWAEMPWSSTESDCSSKFRLQPPEYQGRHLKRLLKVHSEDAGETLRPCVAKSYSFGGYGGSVSMLSRGDSVMSTHSAGPRLLTKQDSAASSVSWRLSPSSSGYKSQSQMSESVTPSPTSTPHPMTDSRQDSGSGDCENQSNETQILWAVTDIHNVPKGSIIINPQTGKPLKNDDGSIYHYDPNNPPPYLSPTPSKPPPSPVKPAKERPASPQKTRPPRISPTRKSSVATSPNLPFSPALPTSVSNSRSYPCFQVISSCESLGSMPPQQHFTYSSSFPPAEANVPVYQQPYVVYTAPYDISVQQQYDNRMEPPIQEVGTYYVSDNTGMPPGQAITYQQQPSGAFWNQQPVFYQGNPHTTNPTPPQRFPVPLQPQGQTAYVPAGYQPNYIPPAIPPAQNPDIIPMYPSQTVQMVYPTQPNAVYPPHQQHPVMYTHSPLYHGPYPAQNTPQTGNVQTYPPGPPTPSSCVTNEQGFLQLTHGMQQMSLGGSQVPPKTFGNSFLNCKYQQAFDNRPRGAKGNGKLNPKGMMGSGQSSTGTTSPAATVIAGYCPQNPGLYRTPPATPPAQFAGYPPNFGVPPLLFRQMSTGSVRTATPSLGRSSSRSPTPAGDIAHFDRQRMALQPNVYQGMPYVVQHQPNSLPWHQQENKYNKFKPVFNV